MLRKPASGDLTALRRKLTDLEAEVATIEAELDTLSTRRESLEAELAATNGDLVARWKLDEQLAEVREQTQQLIDKKVRPSVRAAQLRAALMPVIQRERDVERRALQIAHHEQLLDVHALLQRVGETTAEARRLGRQVPGGSDFDAAMRKLEQVITHWDTTVTPQLRRQLSDNRRFIAAVEVER